jgi:hypothetical protein
VSDGCARRRGEEKGQNHPFSSFCHGRPWVSRPYPIPKSMRPPPIPSHSHRLRALTHRGTSLSCSTGSDTADRGARHRERSNPALRLIPAAAVDCAWHPNNTASGGDAQQDLTRRPLVLMVLLLLKRGSTNATMTLLQ